MILNAFTVYDSKAEAYLPPFFTTTPALAMRSFAAAANSEGHDFQNYAADYNLFQIGTFDDSTGRLDYLEHYSNLGSALSFIEQKPSIRTEAIMEGRGLELARSEKN